LDSSRTAGQPPPAQAVRRDLVFMCADSGTVLALTYLEARRAVIERAVIFLASGQTLWVDAATSGTGRAATVERQGRQGAAGYELRMSAQAAPLTGASQITAAGLSASRPAPVGFTLAVEPVSIETVLADRSGPARSGPSQSAPSRPVHAQMISGSGSLAVGSVIYHLHGSGWSSSAQPGADGDFAGFRARAVFQDGSGLFTTRRTVTGPAQDSSAQDSSAQHSAAPAQDDTAALVRNTEIRQVPVQDLVVTARGGGPARKIAWTSGGRLPQRVTGEIRSTDQSVAWIPAEPGDGHLSASITPFIFVRSGVTGLGLVERISQPDPVSVAPAALDTLPDPY